MYLTKTKSMAATILAAILMGCLGFFVREAQMDASATAFFRFLIGFFLVSCIVLLPAIRKKKKIAFSSSSFFSGIAISLCILFYFYAIQKTSIGLAAFTLYLGPVFAIIGEAILSAKFPSLKEIIIISLAFIGFFFISSLESIEGGFNMGLLLALLSGVFYGAYILINRIIPQEVKVNIRVFWQFCAAILVLGLTCLFRGERFEGIEHGWPYLLTIGFVQGFFVLLLTGYAIKNLSSIEFGALSYVEPLVAVILGFYLYNEALNTMQLVGILLIIVATVFQCFAIGKEKKQ